MISARQLDADRFAGKGDDKAAEPVRLLPALRALLAAIPQAPIPAQIEFGSEQIMLGGRPLQNIAADLHADAKSWIVDRLDFRAPGATHVSLSGTDMQPGPSGSFRGALDVEFVRSGYAGGVAAGPQRGQLIAVKSRCGCVATSVWPRTALPSMP